MNDHLHPGDLVTFRPPNAPDTTVTATVADVVFSHPAYTVFREANGAEWTALHDDTTTIGTTAIGYEYRVLIGTDFRNKAYGSHDEARNQSFVETWSDTIYVQRERDVPWAVLNRHNRDDRPDGQVGPSFSVGDAVAYRRVEDEAWTYVIDIDCSFVTVDSVTVVEGKTWSQVFDEAV